MSAFVDAYVHGKAITQDVKPLYGKFISKELDVLGSNIHKEFWINYLADYELRSNNLKLFKNESIPFSDQLVIAQTLDPELNKRILDLTKDLKISPDIIFLAVYNLVLCSFYNTNDLVIGTVMNNRLEEEGGDKVFGLHLNTVPIRFKTGRDKNQIVKDYLLEVFNNKLHINQYKLYPYGKIKLI